FPHPRSLARSRASGLSCGGALGCGDSRFPSMKPVALACLAVLLLTACSDQQPLQPPAGSRPSALIMDGAHHGGNPDFFFLPPLAADPTGGPNFDPGKFNPNLSPTAEVCRLSGDPASGAVDCATDTQNRPVLVFGPKPMVLAVEQYQVTWDTKSPTLLDASKFDRIIVRGAPRGSMLGLLDVDPVTGGLMDVRTREVVQLPDGSRFAPVRPVQRHGDRRGVFRAADSQRRAVRNVSP